MISHKPFSRVAHMFPWNLWWTHHTLWDFSLEGWPQCSLTQPELHGHMLGFFIILPPCLSRRPASFLIPVAKALLLLHYLVFGIIIDQLCYLSVSLIIHSFASFFFTCYLPDLLWEAWLNPLSCGLLPVGTNLWDSISWTYVVSTFYWNLSKRHL